MNLGKKLYRSTSIPTIKILAVLISVVVFLNLYFQTFGDEEFLKLGKDSFSDVWNFHLFYPEELIFYLITILIPAIYYGFIRGVNFFEEGVVINRGLPFFNMTIPYSAIEKYELIHPKFFMAIRRKDTEDDILFTINDVDRVLAILDQNNISGDLGKEKRKDMATYKKLIIFLISSGIVISLIQYSGLMRYLFR